MTRGILRALPATPDSRQAFLLLSCHPPTYFVTPSTPLSFLLKLATVLGFFGMLRFSAFQKIKPTSIILVAESGYQTLLTNIPVTESRSICRRFIGFFFRFRGKSTPIGDPPQAAYFPRILDISPSFTPFCPLYLISQMHMGTLSAQRGESSRNPSPRGISARTLCTSRGAGGYPWTSH